MEDIEFQSLCLSKIRESNINNFRKGERRDVGPT